MKETTKKAKISKSFDGDKAYCPDNFNPPSIFFGMVVVFIGLGFLLNNIGIIYVNFDFWKLWPLVIIFIGLSLFNKKSIFGDVVGALVLLITVFFVGMAFLSPAPSVDVKNIDKVTPISVPLMAETKSAKIEIISGIGQLNISGMTEPDRLVSGNLASNFMEINPVSTMDSSVQTVSLEETGKKINSSMRNSLLLGLNQGIPMDISLKGAVSDMNIDLSNVISKNVNIDSGASSLNLKLGNKADTGDVDINAGTGSTNIYIPNDVGVVLRINSGLSSTSFKDFRKISDNMYQSGNYVGTDKKINLNINVGLSSLIIDWYTPQVQVVNAENTQRVELFYYNRTADKNSDCGGEYVQAVERQIPLTKTPIKDTINLLISGQLTQAEKEQGFMTEFPNPGFKLLEANYDYDSETLILKFTEVPGFTDGGSCRVSILAAEIIKTVKQFGVKNVVFSPESLFQP